MNKNGKIFFIKEFERTSLMFLSIFIIVVLFTAAEIFYFMNKNVNKTIAKKKEAVELVKLPDVAVVTEATWLRHRSITNIFTVFPEDGSLLDYYPASFVYKMNFPQKHIIKN